MVGESHEMCGWVCDLWTDEWREMRRSGLYDMRNGAGDDAEHRDIGESHVAHRRKTSESPDASQKEPNVSIAEGWLPRTNIE